MYGYVYWTRFFKIPDFNGPPHFYPGASKAILCKRAAASSGFFATAIINIVRVVMLHGGILLL